MTIGGKQTDGMGFVTMLLGTACTVMLAFGMFIVTSINDSVKSQGKSLNVLTAQMGSIKADVINDGRRMAVIEGDNQRQDDRARAQANTLANHEVRITSNTARVDDLDRRFRK